VAPSGLLARLCHAFLVLEYFDKGVAIFFELLQVCKLLQVFGAFILFYFTCTSTITQLAELGTASNPANWLTATDVD